ncbi:hypothetical protein [Acerihabitans sp. TG2]
MVWWRADIWTGKRSAYLAAVLNVVARNPVEWAGLSSKSSSACD